MKVINVKSQRTYTITRAKYQAVADWCQAVKPVSIKIGGVTIKAYGLPTKSNYIYMMWNGWAHCVWCKDPKEFDFLKEKSLKVADPGPKAKAKAEEAGMSAAKATAKPKREVRVIKREVLEPATPVIVVPVKAATEEVQG